MPTPVHIILCTYNGEKYLDEQMTSLFAQDWRPLCIWAKDDGSTDATMDILQKWAARTTRGGGNLRST